MALVPTVQLIGPNQEFASVNNTIDFNRYVFGLGYSPTGMSVSAAYELLLNGPINEGPNTSFPQIVFHWGDESRARPLVPDGWEVLWIGSVYPLFADVVYDTWWNTL